MLYARAVRSDTVNFGAGPAGLPTAALERAHAELLDYQGTGASIMELSHRGRHYDEVHHEALTLVRELLAVPKTHEVLFIQGGASGMFGLVPLNFLPPRRSSEAPHRSGGRSADYVMTGVWSDKALSEAQLVGSARPAGTGEVDGAYRRIPEELDRDPDAAYLHFTSNNTVVGTQFRTFPERLGVPIIADMSSDILSRPLDFSRLDLVYAGAQKNLGPSGVVLVVASRELLDRGSKEIPQIFQLSAHAEKASLLHTPPTFSIYLVRNVLSWIRDEGGVLAMKERAEKRAAMLYAAIDDSGGFYRSPVDREARSFMNVTFRLPTPELEAELLRRAEAERFMGLAGHRSVGGLRASLYNPVSLEGVERFTELMKSFLSERG